LQADAYGKLYDAGQHCAAPSEPARRTAALELETTERGRVPCSLIIAVVLTGWMDAKFKGKSEMRFVALAGTAWMPRPC